MSQERFEKGMEELRSKIDAQSSTTSPNDIFQAVKAEKMISRKSSFGYAPMVAAVIGVFLIGGLLLGSLFSGSDVAQEGGTTPPPTDAPLVGGDEGEKDDTFVVDRPDSITVTVYPEGMEEEENFKLYVNEELRYSTYIHEEMTTEMGSEEDVHSLWLGEIKVSRLFDENEAMKNISFEGYEEILLEEAIFDDVAYQSVWSHQTDHVVKFYIVVEGNDAYYVIEVDSTLEMEDGKFPFVLETFIEELEFH
ncbi:MAG: hypothetical protein LRY73_14760 [Bacillus sp. (in: Bacteria)]|nr:hypothetical protein [Bacillus sp. (in: firmicutes)]